MLHHGFIADTHTDWVRTGVVGTLVRRGRRGLADALPDSSPRTPYGDHPTVVRNPSFAPLSADFPEEPG